MNTGLKVQPVAPDVDAEWRAVLDNVQDRIRGKIIPVDMFRTIKTRRRFKADENGVGQFRIQSDDTRERLQTAGHFEKIPRTVCMNPAHCRRWLSIHGAVLCGICVPPCRADAVAEWFDCAPGEETPPDLFRA